LHLALAGLRVGPGDEVITTTFTFAATVEAIEYVGAQPVLVDIDANDYNIDANLLEDAITPKTRVIMPVHMFGLPADMRRIMEVAERHGVLVIEDCAQSFGAAIDGQATGSFGHAGAFSFYPTKCMGCLGDGGLISTNDPAMSRRFRELRNHGIGDKGEHVTLGFNSRLDELQAAVLQIKLARINEMNERRRQIAAHYDSVLSDAGAKTPRPSDGVHHVYGYYTILVDDRDTLRAQLRDAEIATALYYSKPLHKHVHFSTTCRFGPLNIAEQVAQKCISLPIFPEMTDDEVDYVASTTAALLA
jgi:dTDP-4-amino-4,6-dideoxygalactose transaminase